MRPWPVVGVVSLCTMLVACAPWYTRYGIQSESELLQPQRIPQLVSIVENSRNHFEWHPAMRALEQIGEPAIPGLISLVAGPDRHRRFYAMDALGRLKATAAAPALLACARANACDRRKAYKTLGEIGAIEAVPALLDALIDKKTVEVAVGALRMLTAARPEVATPSVIAALKEVGETGPSRAIRWGAYNLARSLENRRLAAGGASPAAPTAAVPDAPVAARPRSAAAPTGPIAVFDLLDTVSFLKGKQLETLSQGFREQLDETGRYRVVPHAAMRILLQAERSGVDKKCGGLECQTRVAKAAGAAKFLLARIVSSPDRTCAVSSSIVDVATGAPETSSLVRCACNEAAVRVALAQVALKLEGQ